MKAVDSYRALVVDDSRDVRTLLCRALEREGFTCDAASDGIMAENSLRIRQYDVVITDLRMPRKNGHQIIVDLLSRPSAPMVFAITGIAEPKLVLDLLERGVEDVVQKPLSYLVLAAKIKALLNKQKKVSETASRDAVPTSVADSIQLTTENLRQQLALVTETFQDTINQLERQKHQLEAGFLDSLRVFSNLISQSGNRQQSHGGRVEALSEAIGEYLGLHSEPLRSLKYAALLHDIGQFGMPDKLRSKAPWTLEPEELKSLRTYPVIGAALLSEVRGAEEVAEIIEMHCENFNGSGFPNGLKGDQIVLGARILRVADGCDQHRMHFDTVDTIDLLNEHLREESGSAYDPGVVKAALRCIKEIYTAPSDQMAASLKVEQLAPGMVLAENVYDDHGHFLARKGARLSEQLIARLQQLLGGGVLDVYKRN